jgi:two-component system sensor histidine kinase KdpD
VLSSATESLQSDRINSDQRRELHEVIGEASARLRLLVNSLLDLARLQSGTSSPSREWIDLEEVVLAAVAGQPDLEVEVDIGRLPLIRADSVQLERAFSNLLENARKHGRGERVKVTATASDSEVRVEISDAGPGLDQALGEQMFEPFRSGGETEGSGLGLAIVRGFVEANDGRVWADSGSGAGARFVVALPLTDPPEREPTPGGGER